MNDRMFAIGDIHGCSKALAALLNAIRPTQNDTLVFLGDFIDRGPDSKGVLDQLITLSERCNVVPIMGNHEEMLLGALDGGVSDLQFWLNFGGTEMLASYGCRDAREVGSRDDLWALVSHRHVDFVKNCRDFYTSSKHIFVHAYYDPVLPLAGQKQSVLRWGTFPKYPEPHCSGKIAIVGHMAQENGEILDLGCLKCIDTFCHGGGWLTALEVNTGQVLQANMAGELRD